MDDDIRPIRISRHVFEMLADNIPGRVEVHWGPPDEEGFYTPAIFVTEEPARSWWQRLMPR